MPRGGEQEAGEQEAGPGSVGGGGGGGGQHTSIRTATQQGQLPISSSRRTPLAAPDVSYARLLTVSLAECALQMISHSDWESTQGKSGRG
ncbi:hypothetical protein CCHR01_03515 [Colletotrichum chrysophilum]|uniref:Uncharacterized protein n=1 Tax=Colletotrichum chrysophilum TaxID=1836956 RepID=A0AAD9ENI9_9PEZI|nr:hypothetical protein CCHR01_03515 [Colletotrichum chrysophilum]